MESSVLGPSCSMPLPSFWQFPSILWCSPACSLIFKSTVIFVQLYMNTHLMCLSSMSVSFPFCKDSGLIGLWLTLMTSFDLWVSSLETRSCSDQLGIWASRHRFEGNQSIIDWCLFWWRKQVNHGFLHWPVIRTLRNLIKDDKVKLGSMT